MRDVMTSDATKRLAAGALFALLTATTAAQAKNPQAAAGVQPTFTGAQLAQLR